MIDKRPFIARPLARHRRFGSVESYVEDGRGAFITKWVTKGPNGRMQRVHSDASGFNPMFWIMVGNTRYYVDPERL